MAGWASREHWLTVALPTAIHRGREVLKRHHIAPVTLARVLAIHARHADDSTGRAITVSVEHVLREAGCSERTVQRARACARELGIATEVFRGRHLTLDERLEAWEAGSAQRGLVSVYALGVPRWLALHLPQRLVRTGNNPQPRRRSGERGTPPSGRSFNESGSVRSRTSSATSADELAALEASTNRGSPDPGCQSRPSTRAPRHSPTETPHRAPSPGQRPPQRGDDTRPRRARPRWNSAAIDLAVGLQREIPALRRTQLGRLIPAVTRFATSPTTWTVDQLVALIWHTARTRGWTTRQDRIRRPAAWLAHLLQGIADTNPEDLPAGHPDRPDSPAPTEIALDDPWADTLLKEPTSPTSPATTSTPATPRAWPEMDSARSRRTSLWDRHERAEREQTAHAERTALHAELNALRAELRGQGLCAHGAPEADASGRSSRCALCRHQR